MSEKQKMRRETGMLVIGVVLGGLFGIIGGLWSAYYVEWLKSTYGPNPNWTPTIIWSSLALVVIVGFLIFWARKQLKS
jgi:fructose-specific phosphotransferase system IIC component